MKKQDCFICETLVNLIYCISANMIVAVILVKQLTQVFLFYCNSSCTGYYLLLLLFVAL